jgi:hypothetical protein
MEVATSAALSSGLSSVSGLGPSQLTQQLQLPVSAGALSLALSQTNVCTPGSGCHDHCPSSRPFLEQLDAFDHSQQSSVPRSWTQPGMIPNAEHQESTISALGLSPVPAAGYMQYAKPATTTHMQFPSAFPTGQPSSLAVFPSACTISMPSHSHCSQSAGNTGNVDDVIGTLESVEAAGIGR